MRDETIVATAGVTGLQESVSRTPLASVVSDGGPRMPYPVSSDAFEERPVAVARWPLASPRRLGYALGLVLLQIAILVVGFGGVYPAILGDVEPFVAPPPK